MKKFIIIGTILAIDLAIFGAVSEVLHMPKAAMLLTFGIGLFCFVFFPLAIRQAYRDSDRTQKPLYFTGLICTVIVFVGALFKVMHWPGAGALLFIGVPLPFVLFMPLFIYYHAKSKEKSIPKFLGVMFLMVFIALFSSLLALNVSYDVLKSYQSTYIDMEQSNTLIESRNQSLYAALDHAANETTKDRITTVKQKSEAIYSFIDNTKADLLIAVNGEKPFLDKSGNIDIEKIADLNETVHPNMIMHGHNEVSGASRALKELLNQYKTALQTVVNENSTNVKIINDLLSTNDQKGNEEGVALSWENRALPRGAFVIVILGNLESIKTSVLLAEQQALLAMK